MKCYLGVRAVRVMGLDVGDKTIGVAVSDDSGLIAQGLETIRRSDLDADLRRLKELTDEYQVETIVLGLPKNMNGTLGPQAEKVQRLGDYLKQQLGLKIQYWDERMTTMEAERILLSQDVSRKKRKKVIDKLAATVILRGFLDRKGPGA